MTKKISLFGVYSRGLAMGAADIVPGVSGGTVALMTGIYDRLIESLKQIGCKQTWTELRQWRIVDIIQRIDAIFLCVLFAGIITSIIGLSSAIIFLMIEYPYPLWSFFLGLILAAAFIMFLDLKKKGTLNRASYSILSGGALIAFLLGRLTPQEFDVHYWHYFIGGAIAICAMILPGISGSFLLLMMGLYGPILNAVQEVTLIPITLFAGGCCFGLLSFSHLLSWCLYRFPQGSYCFLIGLMLGAIEKLWPWKQIISTRIKSSGEIVPLVEKAISPFRYESLYQESASIGLSLLTFCIAFMCILVVGRKDSLV